MTHIIKKYKNRRLYDMTLSQYITIEDLRQYVIKDREFKVIDSSNNQDVTNTSLLQILLEQESGTTRLLSDNLMRQLIRFSAHPLQKQFSTMLEQNITAIEQLSHNQLYEKTITEWSKTWQDAFELFHHK